MSMHNRAFTLLETIIAVGMGMAILVAGTTAVRMAMGTMTKANRLSLENSMLRSGIIAGLDEVDMWQVYDAIHIPSDASAEDIAIMRPLRDSGEPFSGIYDPNSPSATAIDVDPDLNQPQLNKTWWRGFGYYNYWNNGSHPCNRWGDYSLVQHLHNVGNIPDPIVDPDGHERALRRSYQALQQRTLLENLGAYAAWDLAPASMIWFYENDPYTSSWPFQVDTKINRDDRPRLGLDDDEDQFGAGDRNDVSWLGCYWMTTWQHLNASMALTESPPAYKYRNLYAWAIPMVIDGEARGDLEQLDTSSANELKKYRADAGNYSAATMLKYGRERNVLIDPDLIPEHWPRIELQRMSWTLQGQFRNWVRVTTTDPLTARQVSVSMEGQGSTLRGARMLRKIAAYDAHEETTP